MTHNLPDSLSSNKTSKQGFMSKGRRSLLILLVLFAAGGIFAGSAATGLLDLSAVQAANTDLANAQDFKRSRKTIGDDQTANRTEVSQYFQGFENDGIWSPSVTVNRVPSGTNGIASKTGSFHAQAVPGNSTFFGGYNATFPANGYTTSLDIYLNTAGGYANDSRFDYTSAISQPDGNHRRDFMFNCGFYSDAGPVGSGNRFVCNVGNTTLGWPRNPANDNFVVTNSSGWYTFKHHFYSNGGVLAVDLSIYNSAGALLKTWTLSNPSDIIGTTVGGNRYGWFPAMQFPYLAIDNTSRSNVVAANVETVTSADLTATPNLTDWFFYQDTAPEGINNSLGTFVNGPGTAPEGAGSVQISTSGTSRPNLATYQFSGTALADINELKYSTYNPSAGNGGGSANRSGYLQFNVDFNGSDTWQRRLIFLPSDNGTVTQDTWKEWDTIKNGTALWRHSGPTWPVGIGGGGEPGTTTKTWSQILSQYPGVRIRVTDSWLGIRVGEPYADGYTENIDKFVFGTTSNTTIFDFEPLPIMVDDDGMASSTDCNAADPANLTIQAGINAATAGATVKVCPGNYTEDVAINGPAKAGITLLGSGVDISTITGPHTTGVGDTVQIISAPGVTIDGFTITRTGNNTTDWVGNTQNQGISLGGSPNVTIQNSKVIGNRNGILVEQSSHNVTIRRNIIDFNRTGVHIVDNNNALVEENFIRDNWTMGILYRTGGAGPAPSGITIRNNNISGNWYSEIEFREPAGATLINASGNYLGTTSPTRVTTTSGEPGYAGQIPVAYGGAAVAPASHPTIAGPESARVDYSPFLNSGADTQPATPGFQGNPANVTVNADSAQANVGLNNIQEAINGVPAGGSVTALAGTYSGSVTVNKAISFLGTPTITGTFSVTSAGASVSPGFSPGIINSGNLSLVPSSTVNIELNGLTPGTGHDQLNVTGTVNLGGATLNVTSGFAVSSGNSFVIVNNDGADAVTGTFAGLPQGGTFVVSGTTYSISYTGGTGNDVVLTATVATCNNISIPTNITTLTNQQVVVPLNIDDTTGRGILSFTYTLNYTSSVLSYIGIDQAGTLSSAFSFSVNSTTPGTLVINGYGTAPLTTAGILMNIRFQANGGIGTSSPMNFGGMLLNEGVPCANTTNGLVTVVSSSITGLVSYGNAPSFRPVPNANLFADGSVDVSTTTDAGGNYSLSGLGSGAYTVTPSKAPQANNGNGISGLDSSLISQHVVGLITLNANQLAAADVSNNGTVSGLDAAYISQWVVNIANPSITGTWRFIPASRSYPSGVGTPQTNQDYVGILMGDVTGNWNNLLARPETARQIDPEKAVAVEAANLSAEPGSEVIVPVSVKDLTGKGITAYQFDIEFDANVLEPQEIAAELSTLSTGMTVTSNSPEKGLLKVVVYGVHPIEGAGELVNLRFSAIGRVGTKSSLTVKGFMLNEGEVDVLVRDGGVTIERSKGASIRGRLLSPTGEPIGGSRVAIKSSNGQMRSVVADADGNFEFGGLTIGETYLIMEEAKRPRFEPKQISVVEKLTRVDMIARQ